MKTILVTGAAGFLGSHFVEEILLNTDWNIVALCRMTFVGDMDRILNSLHVKKYPDRIKLIYHDLKFALPNHTIERIGQVDYIAHIAANSHVDRSVAHPREFFEDNVMGTINLLEWYRNYSPNATFINYLTDEVFGPASGNYNFKEDDRWRPSNPYSASKCGQGAAGISYHITYKLPIITTYTMNLFGEKQHPEKLISKSILNIYHNRPIKIHAKLDPSGNVEYVGQRHWLHARNAANATLFLFNHGVPGDHYNVVGDTEFYNDELIRYIANIMGKDPRIEYIDFEHARPGHDRRYSLDGSKLKDMGWKQPIDFRISMEKTIEWIVKNQLEKYEYAGNKNQ
jgi:dTDP-glucose 4,6-dehydratase